MKTIWIALAVSALVSAQEKQEKRAAAPPLKITSAAFADSGGIPKKYTCLQPGGGVSPPLKWTNAPASTVSFAIILHDPDIIIRRADDVVHWVVWNIPGTATELPEDVVKQYLATEQIRQGNTINMKPGYFPPCPVSTAHHYMFELYALDKTVELPPTAGRTELLKEMEGHVVGKAVYVGSGKR